MSSNHRPLDESDILLIHTIRDTPSLYDPQLPSFRLSQRKEEDWARVADVLNISIMDARRRWTCLRDRYSRELKQKRLHPSGEFGHNDFFRKMDFLRSFVRKRRERRGRDRERDIKVKNTRGRRVWISSVGLPLENDAIIEEPSSHEFEEEQHYDAKLEVQTTQSETYSVLVEADEGQEADQESFKEFLDPESEHKTMESHTVVLHPETTPLKGPSPAVEGVDSAHGDLNYVVCMPNVNQERKQFTTESVTPVASTSVQSCSETEDDFFCKSIAAYLRQLSRVHKIKAKVEMYQILEKYILLEESGRAGSG
ncbi:uncharacterized protein LOC6494798 [Drosophila ananassae]|nr:uncharacterized protein LOC6494798 [Drosophila ananassae]